MAEDKDAEAKTAAAKDLIKLAVAEVLDERAEKKRTEDEEKRKSNSGGLFSGLFG